MEGLKIAKCYISPDIPPLHILFTKEDDVIVARCLNFSISSHGENIEEAKEAIGEAIIDYLEHAIENNAIDELFDLDLEVYWNLYRELELKPEVENFKRNLERIKREIQKKELVYA